LTATFEMMNFNLRIVLNLSDGDIITISRYSNN
jgi:CTP-dependent riboflavin kinase